MRFTPQAFAASLALGLTAAALPLAAHATTPSKPASYTYEFKTFFDESTSLNLFDTKTLAYSVATLTVADISGGVQLTLKANSTNFPAKSSSGTFIEDFWLDGPSGTHKLTSSNTSLNLGSGYSFLPTIPELGHSYNWDFDFKAGTFAEGEITTLTITGSGVNAKAFFDAGLPMISLGNVASPWASFSGTTHFLADCTPAIPEPSTYGMAALGLAGLAAWSRRKKA